MSGTTEAAHTAGQPGQPRQRHDFTGKVAIVTGAAQGIGEAYARALAAAGAAVVVADIAVDAGQAVTKQICADGGRVAFVRTDVADPDSARAMAEFAYEESSSLVGWQLGAAVLVIGLVSAGILLRLLFAGLRRADRDALGQR